MKKNYFIVNNGLSGESCTNYNRLKIDLINDLKENKSYYENNDYFYISYFDNNNNLIVKDFYIISFNQVKKLKVDKNIIDFCKNDLRY